MHRNNESVNMATRFRDFETFPFISYASANASATFAVASFNPRNRSRSTILRIRAKDRMTNEKGGMTFLRVFFYIFILLLLLVLFSFSSLFYSCKCVAFGRGNYRSTSLERREK